MSPHARTVSLTLVAIAVLALSVTASADPVYTQDFEALVGSTSGTTLTGQDSFYLPVADSTDFNVYTYAGNTLGLPANPVGGRSFAGGTSVYDPFAGPLLARAQRDVPFIGSDPWTIGVDVAVASFGGDPPATQYPGSFSVGLASTSYFVNLTEWDDPSNPTTWSARMVWYDSFGSEFYESVPDSNFWSLPINHWYRWETEVNLATNQIVALMLTDLDTMTTFTYNPPDRYMLGGSVPQPPPDYFRLFAGGLEGGNSIGFDNIRIENADIIPEPTTLALVALGLGALARRRRRR